MNTTIGYLCWFDDNKKKPLETKALEAIETYVERFRSQPNIVLVSAEEIGDCTEIENVKVRTEGWVRKNHYFVGYEVRQ